MTRLFTFALLVSASGIAQAQLKPISRAEFLKSIDSSFAAVDVAHHGFLTKNDLAADQQRSLARAKAAVEQNMRTRFNQLDTNKDGKLSFEEFMAMAPTVSPTDTPDQLMQRIDANRDGKITLEEFRAAQMAKFNRMDTNHDGVLSPAEQQAALGKK